MFIMLHIVEILSPSTKLKARQINLGKNVNYHFLPGSRRTWKTQITVSCERAGCISIPAVQPLRSAAGSQGKQLDSQGCGFLTAHTVLVLVPSFYSSRLRHSLSLTSKETFTSGWSSAAVSRHNISAASFCSASWFLFHEPRHGFVDKGCSRKFLLWKSLFTPCLAVTMRDLEIQRKAVVVTMAALMNHSIRNVSWCHRSWSESCLCLAIPCQKKKARGLCWCAGSLRIVSTCFEGVEDVGCWSLDAKEQSVLPDFCCYACVYQPQKCLRQKEGRRRKMGMS